MDYSNLITGKDSFMYNFRHGEIFHDPNVEKFLKTKSYNKIWFTSDLHLFKDTYKGEKSSNYYLNIMKKFTRIERKLVSENGVFIYSGDILYRNAVEDDEYVNMVTMFIKQLKGTKILIRGNHDLFNHEYYTKSMGFDYVTDYVQYNNLFLTHAPYPLDPTDKNTINIHGHIHGERKYMNMEPDRHYDVYAYNSNKYLHNLQDILSEMSEEDYSAGGFYLDPNWEYFEQAKKMYKDYKESGIYNTEQIVEEISKISGESYVENLLINNLIDDVENDDCNTVSLMDEYPYFIPDEMEDLGVFSDNPEDNCYKVSHKDYLDDDDTIDSKTWYNEYKLFCKGIYTENFEKYFPLWKNKVRILCEKLKQNPSNEVKQSLLELGWNPEVEFTDSNRIRATKRVKSFIEGNYDNSNIYNATNINTDIDEDIVEETYKEKLYPVYIVLSYTNTPFGRLCIKVTKGKYSHSGIALDADLKRIYTFTGDAKHGFAVENLDIYSQNCEDNLSKLGVYCIFVTKEDLKKIKIKLDYFLLNRYDFKYSYLGIITLLMNKDVHFNNAMICSQFVSFILKSANINLIGKADSLVQPDDYYNIKNKKIYLLYDGHIKGYDSKAIQKKVDKLAKTAYYVNESSLITEVSKSRHMYHGSPKQGLKYIEARSETVCLYLDDSQDHVFATDDIRFAACFGAKWNDEIARQGTWDNWKTVVMGINFDKVDMYSPCSIYELDPTGFKHLHGKEYVNKAKKVKVIKEIKYSSFKEMLEDNGVLIISYDDYKKAVGEKLEFIQSKLNSSLDSNFKSKGYIALSTLKREEISEKRLKELSKKYTYLRHYRIVHCKGFLYFKNNDLVGAINVGYKDNGEKWIQAFEISEKYQGYGLSKQLLNDAVYELGANHLSVNKKNKIAINIYKKYGFKKYDETEYMYMMKLDDSKILSEEKELAVQFNDKGDLLIKNPKKVNLREEYFKSHEIIIEYNKANNIEGIKYELARLWYLNCLLESKLYGNKVSNIDKKEYTTVRAKVLNDFKKYMNVVHKYDKSFNFDMYYNETPFSDNKIKINNSTLKYSAEKIKNVLKLL